MFEHGKIFYEVPLLFQLMGKCCSNIHLLVKTAVQRREEQLQGKTCRGEPCATLEELEKANRGPASTQSLIFMALWAKPSSNCLLSSLASQPNAPFSAMPGPKGKGAAREGSVGWRRNEVSELERSRGGTSADLVEYTGAQVL